MIWPPFSLTNSLRSENGWLSKSSRCNLRSCATATIRARSLCLPSYNRGRPSIDYAYSHTTYESWSRLHQKPFLNLRLAPSRKCFTLPELSSGVAAGELGVNSEDYRLPTNVKPKHYDLTIRTDLEKHTFDGFVAVDLDVLKETSTIVLNTSQLKLGEASVYSDALKTEQIQSSTHVDAKTERVTITFGSALPAGTKAKLRIGFTGELDTSMAGYYRSKWTDDGKAKYYGLTQFEPTAARKAFPCWDEPLLKATFAVTMISREGTTNLSNMPAISEEVYVPGASADSLSKTPDLAKFLAGLTIGDQSQEKWKITRFDTTPPMSTYIVAWANGKFAYLEDSYTSPLSGKKRPLRIYATKDHIHQAQFALDVKKKSLPLYEQVFDVEYPLPKLDTVVASDFDSGAMENWGLITGRTSAFLVDPEKAELRAKMNVADTQCHEVAHMWFGNITTMSWWDNLYLNEGFATLMGEVIIPSEIWPEWKPESRFINMHLVDALAQDAQLSSHPIEVECPDANKINQIFDSLSYSKAASVLRMLASYVGEDRFLKGVSIYLKQHLYANSVTRDLWEGVAESTGIDVPKVMDNWVSKMGFPVISVTETDKSIHVRQDRFLSSGPADPKENETIWTIPLQILSVNGHGKAVIDKDAILEEREQTIPLDTSKPFKLNADTTGLYRVLYTPERLAKIASEAAKENSVFTLNDRMGLVYDTMALSKAGFTKVSSALTLMEILKDEKEFLVRDSIAGNLGNLRSVWFEHDEVREKLGEFARNLFLPVVKQLGFEYSPSDSSDTVALRTLAIGTAVVGKDKGVVEELRARFKHYMDTGDDSKIPADLVRQTYSVAVRYGGRKEYDAMRKIYQKPKTPTAGQAAIAAMCSVDNLELAKETLEFMKTQARDQDVIWFIAQLGSNHGTRRLMAQYFKDNYWDLYKRFEGNFILAALVKMSLGTLSTQRDYDEAVEFFKDKDTSKYQLAYQQVLDNIKDRSIVIERSTSDVLQWLQGRK
ncbi:leucyl aminopeptidase [Heliocybe sulcata]|uniref:Aminopeptidase n=1 Tax=Heliocybe sulcata TaxID=5364 RepID=A0A5C3MPX8_9AGAM|nr:leucyl aminopeptidase [Heliocybe sulcata]